MNKKILMFGILVLLFSNFVLALNESDRIANNKAIEERIKINQSTNISQFTTKEPFVDDQANIPLILAGCVVVGLGIYFLLQGRKDDRI